MPLFDRWRLMLASVLAVCTLFAAGCATVPDTGDSASSAENTLRKRSRVRMELALGYFNNGQTAIALEEINQAIQIDPEFAEPLNVKALIYMRLNSFSVAEDNFKKALQINPKLYSVQHNLAWLYCQQSKYLESFQQFNKLLMESTYFEKPKSLLAFGVCQSRSGNLEEAQKLLQRAFELDSVSPVIAYHLAQVYFQRENYPASQFYLKRVNESDAATAESLWLGVKLERKMGNANAANILGDRLKSRFPQSVENAYLQRGQYDQ